MLDDLWVLCKSRRYGVGLRLVSEGEVEIVARGYEPLYLCLKREILPAVSASELHFDQDEGVRCEAQV